jgi:hypothetical protein
MMERKIFVQELMSPIKERKYHLASLIIGDYESIHNYLSELESEMNKDSRERNVQEHSDPGGEVGFL